MVVLRFAEFDRICSSVRSFYLKKIFILHFRDLLSGCNLISHFVVGLCQFPDLRFVVGKTETKVITFLPFYRVLHSNNTTYRVPPYFAGFYRVLPGFTEFYLVLMSYISFYWILLSFTGVLPSFTGFYWVLLGFTGLY